MTHYSIWFKMWQRQSSILVKANSFKKWAKINNRSSNITSLGFPWPCLLLLFIILGYKYYSTVCVTLRLFKYWISYHELIMSPWSGFFYKNNGWILESMGTHCTLPKWVQIDNIPNAPEFIWKFVFPSPKVLDYNETSPKGFSASKCDVQSVTIAIIFELIYYTNGHF